MKKKYSIAILSLAFVFTASAAYANLSFGTNTITSDGALNLTPTGQPVTINGILNFPTNSSTVSFSGNTDYDGTGAFSSPENYTEFDIVAVSNGYAGAWNSGAFIAQNGDEDPINGSAAVAGQLYRLGYTAFQYNNTTDASTNSYLIRLDGGTYGVSYPLLAGANGDIAISARGSDYIANGVDSNLFVAGDGSGTTIKGGLTTGVNESTLPSYQQYFYSGRNNFIVSDLSHYESGIYANVSGTQTNEAISGVASTTGNGFEADGVAAIGIALGNGGVANGILAQAIANGAGVNSPRLATAYFLGPSLEGGATAVNSYGVFVGDVVGATNNYSIKTGAGLVNFGDVVRTEPTVYSNLPTCNAGLEGGMRTITNSTVNTWGATIAGGGANHVLAYCNGTNWIVK